MSIQNWFDLLLSKVSEIIISKEYGENFCKLCPIAKNIKNYPELGAFAGKYSIERGLFGFEEKPEIFVILGPSDRHYLTGSIGRYDRYREDLFSKYLEALKVSDKKNVAKIIMRLFEFGISRSTSWPKGSWLYKFIDSFCRKYRLGAYFTRIVKCGVGGLGVERLERVVDLCTNYIFDELSVIEPKAVIAVGTESFNLFKKLIKARRAVILDTFSGVYNKRIRKYLALEEGVAKAHANGLRFLVKMRKNVSFWLIPVLLPSYFLNFLDFFTNIVSILEKLDFPDFPLGDFFDEIKHVLKTGPTSIYLYPIWVNLIQIFKK